MKMVKSLLLGSAAGLFAVAGAQAADLPVKAKPVEYVKVCSLYGAGFYYIPGTDTCIKIGGFVRTEWLHNAAGSFSTYVNGADALYTRNTNTLRNRSRIITSFDVRSQTEYGTLRAYARAGWQWTSQDPTFGGSAGTVYLDRAFIQFAGFTFGKTQSFFDFFCTGCYSLSTNFVYADTGGSGTPVAAYTAQFGNGVSATLSIEDHTERRNPIVNLSNGSASRFVLAGTNTDNSEGYKIPDIVGALRVDQAWGSAQISGAAHYLAGSYYGTGGAGGAGFPLQGAGHPDSTWGWAVNGGLTLKMPWDPKDTLSMQGTYCDGATRYCVNNTTGLNPLNGLMANLVSTNTIAAAWADDAYYVTGGNLEKSKMWSAVGAFEHYWTPSLRQSVYGGYASFEANSASVNAQMCAGGADCMDWNAWQVGSRMLWNPVANLDIGLDVMYTRVEGASCARGTVAGAPACGVQTPVTNGGALAATPLNLGSADVWSGVFRVQRNFWP